MSRLTAPPSDLPDQEALFRKDDRSGGVGRAIKMLISRNFWARISLLPALAVASARAEENEGWRAGEPVPLGVEVGPLGATHGFEVRPMMTGDVFGNGPYDLFLSGGKLLPFRRFGPDGVPVYGQPVDYEGPRSGLAGIRRDGGELLAVGIGGKGPRFYRFNQRALTFESTGAEAAKLPTRPANPALLPLAGGKLGVVFSASGVPSRGPAGAHPHSADFRPFDGSGIWRGELGFAALGSMVTGGENDAEVRFPVFGEGRDIPIKCTGMTGVSYGKPEQRGVLAAASQGMFYYYRNDAPDGLKLSPGVFAGGNDGNGLSHPGIFPTPAAIPDPATGDSDLIVGDTSFLWFYNFTGRFTAHGGPVYDPPARVRIENPLLSPGSLPVITAGDVDKDGLVDLVAGNDLGDFFFIRNIGDKARARFAAPLPVEAGGKPLKVQAGYGGIQGPPESRWGYTCPTLFDWNGDGLPDILYNSILGDLTLLLQTPGSSPPAFDAPVPLKCDTMELHLVWRTQPAVTDWGLPGGRPCMIVNDEKNRFRCYWRIDDHNLERGELLKLTSGEAIQAHGKRFAGQFGRTKLQAVDWDQDGVIDLLAGTGRSASIPGPGGLPDDTLKGDARQASVLFLRNAGSNREPVFDYPRLMKFKDRDIALGAHSCSPLAIDPGRGVLDLIVGEEDGSVLYFPREDLSW